MNNQEFVEILQNGFDCSKETLFFEFKKSEMNFKCEINNDRFTIKDRNNLRKYKDPFYFFYTEIIGEFEEDDGIVKVNIVGELSVYFRIFLSYIFILIIYSILSLFWKLSDDLFGFSIAFLFSFVFGFFFLKTIYFHVKKSVIKDFEVFQKDFEEYFT